jgi:hypothetical protein
MRTPPPAFRLKALKRPGGLERLDNLSSHLILDLLEAADVGESDGVAGNRRAGDSAFAQRNYIVREGCRSLLDPPMSGQIGIVATIEQFSRPSAMLQVLALVGIDLGERGRYDRAVGRIFQHNEKCMKQPVHTRMRFGHLDHGLNVG